MAAEQAYRGARVAVVGATGFIGRWVCRALCEAGAQLTLVVRDAARADAVFARYGIDGEIEVLDLCDTTSFSRCIRSARPHAAFNLAAYGVAPEERDADLAHQINALLPAALADALAATAAQGWQGTRLVHAGSALEYGDASGNLHEDTRPLPSTQYGQSKLAGARLLAERSRQHGLSSVTARLFMVYGPGETPRRLLPSLLEARLTGRPLALTEGRQQRDFTYVEDVAAGLLRLGTVRVRPGEIVNLASGRLTSVRQFAETAARVLGIGPQVLRFGQLPTRREEMRHEPVAIDRLRALTGWSPPTPPEEGIRRTQLFCDNGNSSLGIGYQAHMH